MNRTLTSSAVATAIFATSCGAITEKAKKSLVTIPEGSQVELSSQSASEAISAASAGDSEASTASNLLLADSGSPFKSSTKTCVVQADGSALVTIKADLNLDKSASNARVAKVNKTTGSSTETRTWSHPNGVQCVADTHAKLNLKTNPAGYKLKATIERTRQQTMSVKNVKKGTSISSSRSFTMKGDRDISFVSYVEDSANGSSLLEKKISGTMSRSFSFVDKAGQTQTGSFSSSSVGDPIVVRIKRSLTTKELISRELVSGTRRNTLADGTTMEVSFANFVMSGSGENCEAQSGTVTMKSLDSEGTATKTTTCTADSGLLSCKDQNDQEVEIEAPSCDPADEK